MLVEDDLTERDVVSGWLEGFVRVVAAASYSEVLRAVEDVTDLDAFVVSASVSYRSGLDVIAHMRARGSRAPALVVAARPSEEENNRSFDLGARYAVKPWASHRVVPFVREALASPVRRLAARVIAWRGEYGLTASETEILFALTCGDSVADVARRRGIAASTVKCHVHHVLGKTGDGAIVETVRRMLRGA